MHSKLPGLVSDTMKSYNDAKSKILETKDKPRKKNNKQQYVYLNIIFFKKKSLKNKNFFNFMQINRFGSNY